MEGVSGIVATIYHQYGNIQTSVLKPEQIIKGLPISQEESTVCLSVLYYLLHLDIFWITSHHSARNPRL